MRLEDVGWDDFFAKGFEPYAALGYEPGRVFLQHHRLYELYTASGETQAGVAGRLFHRASGAEDLPAVGDWVAFSRKEDEGKAVIREVLPRRSKFSRKTAGRETGEQVVAANVDTVFLVTGLDNDYNPRRLERYLVMAWESGARPVVVLNKSDLVADAEEKRREVEAVAPDVPVVLLSARRGEGLEQLEGFVGRGQTVALMGSSGVGKSTIVNALLGGDVQRTQDVRGHDSRGKHTTTHRELFVAPSGALVMDTPGMRELQVLVSERGLRETFDDVREIALGCRFGDCQHEAEPDCAVREALAAGTLDPERFESYRKLRGEMRQLELKVNQRATQDEKARVKRMTRAFNKEEKRKQK